MGSPLSPIIAKLYMEHYESVALGSSQLQPKLWLRYVDDTFIIWQYGKDSIHTFLDHLNGIQESIKFTTEMETNQTIAFLDVLIRRNRGVISTSVFRKKTHTDHYLNFGSHHHPRVFAGVVACLRRRAANVCDSVSKNERLEVAHLNTVFRTNGYTPQPILHKKHECHQSSFIELRQAKTTRRREQISLFAIC